MNNFPLIEMLALFPRYSEVHTFDWRHRYVRKVRQIRSCHTKTLGGVPYSFLVLQLNMEKLWMYVLITMNYSGI